MKIMEKKEGRSWKVFLWVLSIHMGRKEKVEKFINIKTREVNSSITNEMWNNCKATR